MRLGNDGSLIEKCIFFGYFVVLGTCLGLVCDILATLHPYLRGSLFIFKVMIILHRSYSLL